MLIDLGVAGEGDRDMAVRREEGDQRQQQTQDKGDPALDVEEPNPTHAKPSPLKLIVRQYLAASPRWLGFPTP